MTDETKERLLELAIKGVERVGVASILACVLAWIQYEQGLRSEVHLRRFAYAAERQADATEAIAIAEKVESQDYDLLIRMIKAMETK